MSCDIHLWTERRLPDGKYEPIEGVQFSKGSNPFNWQSYGMFGFLAGVRNYSAVPPLAVQRGIPTDASLPVVEDWNMWDMAAHSASWLSVEELLEFNYDLPMENRRVMINNNGGCTAPVGGGEMTTFRKFLGLHFMEDLKTLQECGANRIVFWFDN